MKNYQNACAVWLRLRVGWNGNILRVMEDAHQYLGSDLQIDPEEIKKRVKMARLAINPVKGEGDYEMLWTEDTKEMVLEMFAKGASLTEVKVAIGISDTRYKKWMADEDKLDFQKTFQHGVEMSKALYLWMARVNLTNPRFNSTLWMMQVSNRYGYQSNKGSTEIIFRNTEEEQIETVRGRVNVQGILTEHAASIPMLKPAEVARIYPNEETTEEATPKKPPIPRKKSG